MAFCPLLLSNSVYFNFHAPFVVDEMYAVDGDFLRHICFVYMPIAIVIYPPFTIEMVKVSSQTRQR